MTAPLLLLAVTLGAAAGKTQAPPPAAKGPTSAERVAQSGKGAAASGEEPAAVSAVTRAARSYSPVAFSHRVHGQPDLAGKVSCEGCHALVLDGNRSRTSPVSICQPCHAKDRRIPEYQASAEAAGRPPRTGSPPPIHRIHAAFPCEKCHASVRQSDQVGDFPLPPTDNTDATCVQCHGKAVRFSHAVHVAVDDLSAGPGPKSKVGSQCSFCHTPTPQGVLFATPGHAQCWSCHDIQLLGLTTGCNLCHLEQVRAKKDYNIEDASLRHKEHLSLKCADCHAPILTAKTLPELKAARVESAEASCKRCHQE